MTNKINSVLYVGVTNNIERRVNEHKSGMIKGFTERYNLKKCVMVEEFGDIKRCHIKRKKQIKILVKRKKLQLIKSYNPDLNDLSEN